MEKKCRNHEFSLGRYRCLMCGEYFCAACIIEGYCVECFPVHEKIKAEKAIKQEEAALKESPTLEGEEKIDIKKAREGIAGKVAKIISLALVILLVLLCLVILSFLGKVSLVTGVVLITLCSGISRILRTLKTP